MIFLPISIEEAFALLMTIIIVLFLHKKIQIKFSFFFQIADWTNNLYQDRRSASKLCHYQLQVLHVTT